MMVFLSRGLLVWLFVLAGLVGSAQKLDSMMNIYRDNFPQEKIHVHFDKSNYNPGETIWFKAYIMSGVNLSAISKNFYAELINEKGAVIQRIVAPIYEGSAASSFTVPLNYANEVIHFRAFTTWMLNFDPAFLYDKNIRIVTSGSNAGALANNATVLQFFPEGGDLVSDMETVVAFKANDSRGLPVNVSGFIKSADGKKILNFNSQHDGLGSFKFTPASGQTYAAVWKDFTNKENTTPLPAPKTTGLVLNLKNSPGAVTFMVKRSEKGDLFRTVYLLAHMDQQLVYKARMNLSETFISSGRIPVDQLPSGILQVTLFNSDWQPMAERIVFVNNNEYMFDAYLRTVGKNVGKRGKNTIEIEIPDTLLSNFSIAVTDATVNSSNENEDNIYSRLLLTGDLKGYVHNPGYYFSSFADSIAQQLDLVMLTHGWRRFKWEDLAQGKTPPIKFIPENYIALNGNLLGVDPGTLSRNNELNLIIQYKDSSSQFLSVPIQPGGKIYTSGMVFYDTAKVFYQLNNKEKRRLDNLILNVESGLWKGYPNMPVQNDLHEGVMALDKGLLAKNREIFEQTVRLESDRTQKVKMLQEVIVRGTSRSALQKVDDKYASGLFKGGDGYSFDVANDVSAMGSGTLFNYLQGKVPGLMISNSTSSQPSLTWRGGAPDLYLDEMRSDAQMLSSMSMADIAYIKVFRPPFMGPSAGGGAGAIAVYTKRGGDVRNDDFKGLSKVNITGFTPVKEFYSPNYAQNDPLHALDDLRTTLYWSPFIFLDKENRKTTVSFYNNDISKKLRVVLEGVNGNGKLTRVESVIE